MKSKKIVFIADFYDNEIKIGGAEKNDAVLIQHLKKKHDVVIYHSIDAERAIHENKQDCIYLIGNFVGMSENAKKMLQTDKRYIIYEHDHKYITTRNPAVFPNYKIPQKHLINVNFYRNACAVVVLSQICKEIIEDNLCLANVHSIGSSLWSEKKFDFLLELNLSEIKKDIPYAVLGSKNPTKGTAEAANWCKTQNIPFIYIGSPDEKEFLKQLVRVEKLVFMPQVLETFCRLVVEAKMLNCKLITKSKLLGFASEDCFELSGVELIGEMRSRVEKALEFFEDLVDSHDVEKPEEESKGLENQDITAILTCYRRPHLLNEQIQTLRAQTNPPKEIWVWVNNAPENEGIDFNYGDEVKIFRCNHNWKFFGRFAAAMLANTEFVAIYDDDTMPGKKWHQNCLETMQETPGILGGIGVVLPGERYYGHQRVGWSAPNEQVEQVDLVGHAWFFKRDWLQYFWREQPYTWENGEDIHFSYVAQKYAGIKTYVPPHPKDDPEMFSSLKGMEYGVDDVATSATRNHQVFYKQRDACVKHAIDNGWKLVK